jgi:hypothetical protein
VRGGYNQRAQAHPWKELAGKPTEKEKERESGQMVMD